ncbi:hypothetical protein ATE84_4958 [Aquimarina sp. MAR_2010_214]|uniref:hypothetical protein n=1 Tax=Aquimarina sp. MAR_2010_214 TaxID=1250026 RepID=UPI000CC32703|nr:hypothetical protein [Aquimarina sp. MAR_2010_214]PKV52830.1 hypothetical protein ATE84_4958 [Aquimarina sp. MAR_2010_214]
MDYIKNTKTIERFDGHNAEINTKGVFILALNVLIIISVTIITSDLTAFVSPLHLSLFKLITSLIILFSIFSILITVYTITPHSSPYKKFFWFFNGIANSNNKEDEQKDIDNQVSDLEKGLKRKHKGVKMALLINFIQLLFLTYITYIIVF